MVRRCWLRVRFEENILLHCYEIATKSHLREFFVANSMFASFTQFFRRNQYGLFLYGGDCPLISHLSPERNIDADRMNLIIGSAPRSTGDRAVNLQGWAGQ